MNVTTNATAYIFLEKYCIIINILLFKVILPNNDQRCLLIRRYVILLLIWGHSGTAAER